MFAQQHTQHQAVFSGQQRSGVNECLHPLSSSSLIWLPLHLSGPSSSWPSLIFTLLPSGNTQPTVTNLPGCRCADWYVGCRIASARRSEREGEGKQWREGEKEREQNTEYKAHPRQLFLQWRLCLSYSQHTHTHTTSALVQCLNLSLFVTTLYDQQLREKDTLRGRAGQTKRKMEKQ